MGPLGTSSSSPQLLADGASRSALESGSYHCLAPATETLHMQVQCAHTADGTCSPVLMLAGLKNTLIETPWK